MQPGRLSSTLFYYVYLTAMSFRSSGSNPQTRDYLIQWTKAMYNYNGSNNASIIYGISNEENAVHEYELRTGHKVSASGVWLFPNAPLYSSPDGIIRLKSDQRQIEGVLEVKCPKQLENPNNSISNLSYLAKDCKLNHNTKYYFQVQGHLAATQAAWCDFVIWAPTDFARERIFPDQEWMSVKLPIIKDFLKNQMLPMSFSPDFWENIMTR